METSPSKFEIVSSSSLNNTKESLSTINDDLIRRFKQIPTSQLILNKRTLVDIHADKSILEALQLMHANEIHALPVYGEPTHWIAAGGVVATMENQKNSNPKLYLGIVSISDILSWVLLNTRLNEHSLLSTLTSTHIVQVVGLCKESQSLWIASPQATLLSIMEPLTKGLHRWLIPWTPLAHFSLCTQSDVLWYLSHQAFPMPNVNALKLMSQVQGFPSTTLLRDLIHWMLERDYSVAPIVNEESMFLGVIHVYSFRSLSKLQSLLTSEVVSNQLHVPIQIDSHATFASIVKAFLSNRVHEVWVIKPTSILKGVITLTDVLKAWFDLFLRSD